MSESNEMQKIAAYLRKHTAGQDEATRVDDCIRLGAFLVAMREKGEPICVDVPGVGKVEVLEHIGALWHSMCESPIKEPELVDSVTIANARRYEWLRREGDHALVCMPVGDGDSWVPYGEELDQAIDLAMAKG